MAKTGGQNGETGIIGAKPVSPADQMEEGHFPETTEDNSQEMANKAASEAARDGGD